MKTPFLPRRCEPYTIKSKLRICYVTDFQCLCHIGTSAAAHFDLKIISRRILSMYMNRQCPAIFHFCKCPSTAYDTAILIIGPVNVELEVF